MVGSIPGAEKVMGDLSDLVRRYEARETEMKASGIQADDGRVQAINRLKAVVQNTLALLIFDNDIFPSPEFWIANFNVPNVPDRGFLVQMDVMVRFAAIQGLFSAMESDLRCLCRALDPADRGRGGFTRLYGKLLEQAPAAGAYRPLLEILAHVRNAIHNNGVFLPQPPVTGDVFERSHAGREFRFEDGHPMEGLGWDFVVWMAEELLSFLGALHGDATIINLEAVPAS